MVGGPIRPWWLSSATSEQIKKVVRLSGDVVIRAVEQDGHSDVFALRGTMPAGIWLSCITASPTASGRYAAFHFPAPRDPEWYVANRSDILPWVESVPSLSSGGDRAANEIGLAGNRVRADGNPEDQSEFEIDGVKYKHAAHRREGFPNRYVFC